MLRGVIDIPVRRFVRRFGFDVERKRPVLCDLLQQGGIGTVLDVGANVGQYARRLRAWGYRGRIVSFEPLPSAVAELKRRAAKDPLWEVRECALGEANRCATIYVSQESVFSSLRPGNKNLHSAFASALPIATVEVQLRRLDSIIDTLALGSDAVFLKIDTQGYEREVIRGADRSLGGIAGVQLEVSLRPLYEGEPTLPEIVQVMEDCGFCAVAVDPVAYDANSSALLQVDCVFFRSGSSSIPLHLASNRAQVA